MREERKRKWGGKGKSREGLGWEREEEGGEWREGESREGMG